MRATNDSRILSIQGFRAIACICVFLAHSWGSSNQFVNSMLSDLGRLGVLSFFLLSGVLTSRNLSQDTSEKELLGGVKYVAKKVKKFYPLYLLTTVAMLIITFDNFFLVEWQLSRGEILTKVGFHLLLLQSYVPRLGVAYAFNGPAWFLSACLLLWFFTPMMIRLLKKTDKKYYAVIGAGLFMLQLCYLLTIYNFHLTEQRWFMYVCPMMNFSIYLQGILWGGGTDLLEKDTTTALLQQQFSSVSI